MKKNFWGFFLIQLMCFGWTLDHTLMPLVFGKVVGRIEGYTGDRTEIWNAISTVILLGGLLWISIEVMMRVSGILMMRIFPQFEANIRLSMFEYVNHHSHSFFADNFAGSVANKINDMPRSAQAILEMVLTLFIPIIATTIITTVMFTYLHPLFGAVIFTWIVIHMGICIYTSKTCQLYSNVHAESRSRLVGRIVDSFTNNVSVRIFSRRNYEYEFAKRFQQDEIVKHKAALWYVEKIKILLGLLCFLFIGVGLTTLQIYCYKNSIIELSDLAYTFQASYHVTIVAFWAGLELPRLFREIGVCKQSLGLINAPIQIVDKSDAIPIKISRGEIKFDNVTFRYEHNNNIFNNQNILIPSGQKVGLVGFSGSGKTTFVNLILRYFDVAGGAIYVDGHNIKDVTQDSLREQIAMIPQEPSLFHRSVLENIRYGDISATDAQVIEASKKAHCHEFITKLKDKYNTQVGERGLKLSGGQRQRIAIARAILKKAPILIMDEATSALDTVTEKYIQKSIKEMAKDRTTIIIAHRLSTLADMDRILVFKDGYIIEDGRHQDLLKRNGHYAQLWSLQVDGFIPDLSEEKGEDDF